MFSFSKRGRILSLALPIAGMCVLGCFDDDDDDDGIFNGGGDGDRDAAAEIRGYTDTAITGTARFEEDGDSLLVTAEIHGLAANQAYGFHVHEFGDCSVPEASGGHFHPAEPHGNPLDTGSVHHRGDLPNVQTDSAGVGRLTFMTDDIDLESADRSVVSRSVVLHANPDDYVTQPAGGTGERIACGVILLQDPGTDTTGLGGLDTLETDGNDTAGLGNDTLPPYP
jgi:Cu-Zn family superoxide dismutase